MRRERKVIEEERKQREVDGRRSGEREREREGGGGGGGREGGSEGGREGGRAGRKGRGDAKELRGRRENGEG